MDTSSLGYDRSEESLSPTDNQMKALSLCHREPSQERVLSPYDRRNEGKTPQGAVPCLVSYRSIHLYLSSIEQSPQNLELARQHFDGYLGEATNQQRFEIKKHQEDSSSVCLINGQNAVTRSGKEVIIVGFNPPKGKYEELE